MPSFRGSKIRPAGLAEDMLLGSANAKPSSADRLGVDALSELMTRGI
jgi:hypothetical protein